MKKYLLSFLVISLIAISPLSASACKDCPEGAKKCLKNVGKFFKKVDKNSDGVVTKDEVVAQAEARFAKMDKNSDGKVSKEEFKKFKKAQKKKCKKKGSHKGGDDDKPYKELNEDK